MPHAGAWLALFAAAGAECAWLPWAALPGPDVRLNSVGYTLGQRKRATVVDSRIYHEPTTWKLHQCHYGVPASGDRRFRCLASDASVLNGSFVRMRESDNGRRAWTADFSQVTTPGSYIMSARRRSFGHTMWSNSFNITSDIFVDALSGSLDAFLLARCGVAVGPVFAPTPEGVSDAGDKISTFSHEECHLGDAQSTVDEKHTGAAHEGTHDAMGGWHDAGDYGKYTENTAFSAALLLLAHEHFGESVSDALSKKQAGREGAIDDFEALPQSLTSDSFAAGWPPARWPPQDADSMEAQFDTDAPVHFPDDEPLYPTGGFTQTQSHRLQVLSEKDPGEITKAPKTEIWPGRAPFPPPQSAHLPRLLDEAKWGVEWVLRMQTADGGAYHKISWPGFEDLQILPEDDMKQGMLTNRMLAPVSSNAAGSLAAVAAMASRIYAEHDPKFSAACLVAAKRSYTWLRKNPSVAPPNGGGAFKTGEYDSHQPTFFAGLQMWAASELWEATGELNYFGDADRLLRTFDSDAKTCATLEKTEANAAYLKGSNSKLSFCAIQPLLFDWSNLASLGAARFALSHRKAPTQEGGELAIKTRRLLTSVADAMAESAHAHPYGRPVGSYYRWGVNGLIARSALTLHWAQLAAARDKVPQLRERQMRYGDAAGLGLAHLLGANDYGRSYVTAIGWGPPVNPHHRPSMADHRPWPYMLVGGPHPYSTSWLDDKLAYTTNEIAINWQASLVYALAMFSPGALSRSEGGSGGTGISAALVPLNLSASRSSSRPAVTRVMVGRNSGSSGSESSGLVPDRMLAIGLCAFALLAVWAGLVAIVRESASSAAKLNSTGSPSASERGHPHSGLVELGGELAGGGRNLLSSPRWGKGKSVPQPLPHDEARRSAPGIVQWADGGHTEKVPKKGQPYSAPVKGQPCCSCYHDPPTQHGTTPEGEFSAGSKFGGNGGLGGGGLGGRLSAGKKGSSAKEFPPPPPPYSHSRSPLPDSSGLHHGLPTGLSLPDSPGLFPDPAKQSKKLSSSLAEEPDPFSNYSWQNPRPLDRGWLAGGGPRLEDERALREVVVDSMHFCEGGNMCFPDGGNLLQGAGRLGVLPQSQQSTPRSSADGAGGRHHLGALH